MSSTSQAIVALDTATDDVVVAATREGEVLFESASAPHSAGRPRHGETALRAVVDAVEAAGGWEHVGFLGIGIGPGSFTGLRIGIVTGRALAQATRVAAVPVSTLGALALGIADSSASGKQRPLLPALDARRGELFVQLHDARGQALGAPAAIEPGAIGSWLEEHESGITSGDGGPLAAGAGALRFARELEAAGVEVLRDEDPAHRLAGRWLCSLAAAGEPTSPEGIRPNYLREPDAKRWLERDRPDRG